MKKPYFILFLSAFGGLSSSAYSQSLTWAKQMECSGLTAANEIALDADGNVYTTGNFIGTADFDPGTGIYNLTALSSNGALFVSKLDNSGNFLWAKQMGGATFTQFAYSIAVDAGGNVYSTGYFSGTIDFNPGAGTYNLMSPGAYSVYVSKLDSSGNFVWANQFTAGSGNTDYGYSIAVDDSGNVYTTGQFMSTGDFDPGPGIYNLTSTGGDDIFISKLNTSGNFVWAKKMGGANGDGGLAITLDSSGNIYTTGWFSGTADFDPGSGMFNLSSSSSSDPDIFVSKLDNSGNFVWAKGMGGISFDSGQSIAVDVSGNVYTTGGFMYTVDFDPSPGIYNLSSFANLADIFVSKLDSSGNFIWAKQMGGPESDIGYDIAVDASGNAYTIGYFNIATADFDPGALTYNLTPVGGTDAFISKLDSSGNFLLAAQLGGTEFDDGFGIVTDASQNIYAAGEFRSTADFNPGAGTYNLTCPSFGANAFVVKLSSFPTGMTGSNNLFNPLTIYPNPALSATTISFSLSQTQNVSLRVFDLNGRLVSTLADKIFEAGENEIMWNADEINAGIYFLQIQSDKNLLTEKLIITK